VDRTAGSRSFAYSELLARLEVRLSRSSILADSDILTEEVAQLLRFSNHLDREESGAFCAKELEERSELFAST
jgi:hypothetical protein